jgi:hypothetical protein
MDELGALRALDEAIEGLDLTRLEIYVGVSSGAFLAASLANRMDTATMCRIFLTGDSGDVRFRPETFLRPAVFEYARRVVGLPRLLLDFWRNALVACSTTAASRNSCARPSHAADAATISASCSASCG